MDTKYTIKELKVFKEDGYWYMSAVVETETFSKVEEVRIPKIVLTSENTKMGIFEEHGMFLALRKVDLGFGPLRLERVYDLESKANVDYVVKLIKEKTHEMTIEEIEKKLGYKVKIVSDKK